MNLETHQIRILALIKSQDNLNLICGALDNANLAFTLDHIETIALFLEALDSASPDLILVDYVAFAATDLSVLSIAQTRCPDVPFIFIADGAHEDAVIESLSAGATDYVLDAKLKRLVPVIILALREE